MPQVPTNFSFLPDDPPPAGGSRTIQATPLARFGRAVFRSWQLLTQVVNGQISFGDGSKPDNINGVWSFVADTGLANVDFVVTHNLGRIPVGYLTMTSSIATDIYTGSVASTKTQLTLRSSSAHASLTLFII